METRDLKYNRHGTIDCEINHPIYGWIPFTATPDDTEKLGRDIYAAAIVMEVAPYIAPVPTQAELDATRINEIQQRLSEIDILSIRTLRTKSVGRGQPQDDTTLTTLDNEAEELHIELGILQ